MLSFRLFNVGRSAVTSHLSASSLCSMPARIMACQCPLLYQSSSGFWPYPLSPGLAISALVCLDFAFHLPSSVISFSWHHLYPAFAHVQTISTSFLWGLLPSGTCVPLSRCLHFSHDLLSPTATGAFPLCAICHDYQWENPQQSPPPPTFRTFIITRN